MPGPLLHAPQARDRRRGGERGGVRRHDRRAGLRGPERQLRRVEQVASPPESFESRGPLSDNRGPLRQTPWGPLSDTRVTSRQTQNTLSLQNTDSRGPLSAKKMSFRTGCGSPPKDFEACCVGVLGLPVSVSSISGLTTGCEPLIGFSAYLTTGYEPLLRFSAFVFRGLIFLSLHFGAAFASSRYYLGACTA